MDRAFSIFTVKSVDSDLRIIEGVATTPETDRVGDVIDPEGATFRLPLPLLWQHNAHEPIGHVLAAKVTKAGIEIRAQIAQNVLPRIDEAWALIKSGLVRGLSIGFRATETPEPIQGTFGLRFKRWEWLELSAVTIPANATASILAIKHASASDLAASGTGQQAVQSESPGVTGAVVKTARKDAPTTMKTIAEQIQAFKATRQAKSARMTEIMSKASEVGQTLEEAESTEYDDLEAEVQKVDQHLQRLEKLEAAQKAAAVEVKGTTLDDGTRSRGGYHVVTVKDHLPPGIEFARYAMCVMKSKGNLYQAMEMAKANYPDNPRIQTVLKAAVAAGTTSDATWAGPLAEYQTFMGDFVEYLRPATIIGKFGTDGIPALRSIPFQVRILGQTSGGDGYWVGQGKPKPLTKFDFNATNHGFAKVAAISVLSQELVRFSTPSAEALVRDALRDALVARIDTDFIDPDKGLVANVSPASITNNVAPIATAGSSIADISVDVQAVMAPLITAGLNVASGVWIMTPTRALALSMLKNALGQREHPDISMRGGTFAGFPVIVSQYASTGSPTSDLVIFVLASEIYLSDDGQVTIDASGEASLEMLDGALTQDGTNGTGASLVSLWQNNLLGLRAERFINWSKRRATAVQFIEDVTWGAGGGSPS